jgi:hypothetical protein
MARGHGGKQEKAGVKMTSQKLGVPRVTNNEIFLLT